MDSLAKQLIISKWRLLVQGMSTRQLIMESFPAEQVAQLDLTASTDTVIDTR